MDSLPKTLEELYKFFIPNLAKPPIKPSCISSGMQLDRVGWHIDAYHIPKNDALSVWFYTHPNRGPKWAIIYAKFTDPFQES